MSLTRAVSRDGAAQAPTLQDCLLGFESRASRVDEAVCVRKARRLRSMRPIVQISLDITDRAEAFATAELALRAGVDWLEAGTPFVMAFGATGVRELRDRFPGVPIVADIKIMDGGYNEARMMAKAGATHVVVMARAHPETLKVVVKAGRDHGIEVMGDNAFFPDMVEGARLVEELGCGYVIHHIGYDERRGIAAGGKRMPSPLDQLRAVVDAVSIPVQAVGGLTLEQAVRTPEFGAPLVVIGAPLAIDADSFQGAKGNVEETLRLICDRVHAYGDVAVGKGAPAR
jgi:3-hexulose-6-phosphate synthase